MALYNAGNDVSLNSTTDLSNDIHIYDDLSIVPLEKDSFGKFGLKYESNFLGYILVIVSLFHLKK